MTKELELPQPDDDDNNSSKYNSSKYNSSIKMKFRKTV